jgi:methionine-rich copper-binding protein CopC
MYRRLPVALLLAGIAIVTTATPALAHAELLASTPPANASLATAPATVELTFDEPVTLPENALEVVGPGNVTWRFGTPTLTGATVRAPVTAQGPAGRYTLAYRVISGDGDVVSGSVAFTLTAAATPAATTTATTTTTTTPATPSSSAAATPRTEPSAGDGGTLLWVWLAAGAVLFAALVFVTLRVRRPGR